MDSAGVLGEVARDLADRVAGYDYRHFDTRPAFIVETPSPLRLQNLVPPAATEIQGSDGVHAAASDGDAPPKGWHGAFRRNLETLVGIAAGRCVPLLMVTHPVTRNSTDTTIERWHRMRSVGDTAFPKGRMNDAHEESNALTRSATARHGIPVFDLARLAERSTLHCHDDAHFNIAGAGTAGVALASILATRRLPGPTSPPSSGSVARPAPRFLRPNGPRNE